MQETKTENGRDALDTLIIQQRGVVHRRPPLVAKVPDLFWILRRSEHT